MASGLNYLQKIESQNYQLLRPAKNHQLGTALSVAAAPALTRDSNLWRHALRVLLFAVICAACAAPSNVLAQCGTPGQQGNGGTLTGVVNTYYPGTATANAAATSITLGAGRGSTAPIAAGNLLLVIQMQDATIDSDNDNSYGDGTAGGTASGYTAANNVGRYEFVRATNAVALTGGTVNIVGTGTGTGLLNTYTNAAATATQGQRRFQVVRVPQYTVAILSSTLTASAWNGTTGGILALDASQQITLGGTVSLDGLGFRPGLSPQLTGGAGGADTDFRNLATLPFHGAKGEGIAGTPRLMYDVTSNTAINTGIEGYPNGSMGRGAPGNAGGGGTDGNPAVNDENSGGGGGGNGGVGGNGGNSWTSNLVVGGSGGAAFAQVANNRLVMGGGGGGATRNNTDGVVAAGSGSAGGGIVIMRARRIAGTGTITANGANAFNDTLNDGGGGGGAGGSILISALTGTMTGLTVRANGGRGGDAWRTEAPNGTPGERHGPGGGGGGGIIRLSSAAGTLSVTGGADGITTTVNDAFVSTPGAIGASVTNVTAASIPGIQSGAQCSPTAVRLRSFEATIYGEAVALEWQTGYEIDNLGYQIYREQNGQRVRITPSVIAGSALLARSGTELTAGYSYAWQDRLGQKELEQGLQYWLEDVDLNGTSTLYGPFTPQRSAGSMPDARRAMLLGDLGSAGSGTNGLSEWPTALTGFSEQGNASAARSSTASGKREQQRLLEQQWTLAGGRAVKMMVNRDGWHRVSRAELLAAGLDAGADLSRLQLYADGSEQAISITADGSLEFYGQALNTPSTNTRVYWLVAGTTAGKRVPQLNAGPFDLGIEPSNFRSAVERRDRVLRFAALLNGEDENFFGPSISSAPVEQRLIVKGLDQESGAGGVLEVALQGLTSEPHEVRVFLNGAEVGTVNFSNREHPQVTFNVPSSLLLENENVVTLARGGVGVFDVSLVDFVRLSYPRKYVAENNRLLFSVEGGQAVKVAGFTNSRIRVLDVTNAAEVKELLVAPRSLDEGYAFSLPASSGTRVLLALADEANHPSGITRNEPSSLNAATQSADFVIITHRNFRQAVEPLRLRRQRERLKTIVVDVEDVFDEFSYGAYSPQALRAFLARAAAGWQRAPRYVMLVGDATFDPRRYFGGAGEGELVPGLLLDTAFMETTSDDALADFDNDGLAEMAVGRLPARTEQEAGAMVNRILAFETADFGELIERGALIVSDRPDSFDFQEAAGEIRTQLPAQMPVEMINRNDGDTATVRNRIITGINRGPMLVTYLGHGSVGVWTGDGLLNVADAGSLSNGDRLPFFVMTTCLNGSFMEVGGESLGEALIKAPQGGAIAAWASSGLTEPGGQVLVTQTLYQTLFSQDSIRLGDAIRRAKESTPDPDIRRTWILLGDPTLKLK